MSQPVEKVATVRTKKLSMLEPSGKTFIRFTGNSETFLSRELHEYGLIKSRGLEFNLKRTLLLSFICRYSYL